MAVYTFDDIRNLSLTIMAEPTTQGFRAYGLAFNDDADLVAETGSRHYIGYCTADVLASIMGDLTNGDDIMRDALAAHGLTCCCD